ncbi:MAG: bacteriophage CI repressor [Epsilonproteobacteria bacterium]|nr:bacteriophage CI repressor [Campylobacterota bacterium]
MALIINNHIFKGSKSLLSGKYVTYAEMELPLYNELCDNAKGFDWGLLSPASKQLAFAMLYQITKDEKVSKEYAEIFAKDVLKSFGKKWSITALDVQKWIDKNIPEVEQTTVRVIQPINPNYKNEPVEKSLELLEEKRRKEQQDSVAPAITKQPINKIDTRKTNRTKKRGASKDNVVKQICKEIGITQKELARVLEVPEGTVSSWAVKNEIPRLGKKAIEFYIQSLKQEKIIQKYKSFVDLVQHSA